jgi:hypothetical protein
MGNWRRMGKILFGVLGPALSDFCQLPNASDKNIAQDVLITHFCK